MATRNTYGDSRPGGLGERIRGFINRGEDRGLDPLPRAERHQELEHGGLELEGCRDQELEAQRSPGDQGVQARRQEFDQAFGEPVSTGSKVLHLLVLIMRF